MNTSANIENLVIEIDHHGDVESVEFVDGTLKVLIFVTSEFIADTVPLAKAITKCGFITTVIESSLTKPWTQAYYYVEVFFPDEATLVLFVDKMLEWKKPVIIHDSV